MTAGAKGLKLKAEDQDDLRVLAAALQDSLFRMGDVRWDRRARRVVIVLDRFRWETAQDPGPYERVRAALCVESVLHVRTRDVRQAAAEAAAWLLCVDFDPDPEPPSGAVRLILAGGGEIEIAVECLDAVMTDIGPAWRTPRRPEHAGPDPSGDQGETQR